MSSGRIIVTSPCNWNEAQWDGRQKGNAMLVFLDTEFTDILNPELLSLGLVTLDGREHYAELDLTTDAGKARVDSSSDFDTAAYWTCGDSYQVRPAPNGKWDAAQENGCLDLQQSPIRKLRSPLTTAWTTS